MCHEEGGDTDRYINRELSWLSFNHRVLQEAQSADNPLVERMRFLGIFSNNLDEFYRVRVAYLQRMASVDAKAKTTLGFSVVHTLKEIEAQITQLQSEFDDTFVALQQELRREGIAMVDEAQLAPEDAEFVDDYFRRTVRPSLVPIMLGRGWKCLNWSTGRGIWPFVSPRPRARRSWL